MATGYIDPQGPGPFKKIIEFDLESKLRKMPIHKKTQGFIEPLGF